MTVKILLLCLAIGAACGAIDGIVSTLLRRRHVIFTVICDIFLAAALVGLHTIVSYLYCDGIFFPYAICAQIVSFIVLRIITAKLTDIAIKKLSPKIEKLREKRMTRITERKRKKLEKAQTAQ